MHSQKHKFKLFLSTAISKAVQEAVSIKLAETEQEIIDHVVQRLKPLTLQPAANIRQMPVRKPRMYNPEAGP